MILKKRLLTLPLQHDKSATFINKEIAFRVEIKKSDKRRFKQADQQSPQMSDLQPSPPDLQPPPPCFYLIIDRCVLLN